MPTQIYTSNTGWIEQAEKTETIYPSGLKKVTKKYIYPGLPDSDPPKASVNDEIILSTDASGFTTAIVNEYSLNVIMSPPADQGDGITVWQGTYPGKKNFKTKVLKSGTATQTTRRRRDIRQGNQLIQIIVDEIETSSFNYLADRDLTLEAKSSAGVPTEPAYSPSSVILEQPFGTATATRTWELAAYETTRYGDFFETTYIYEVKTSLDAFVDLT